MMEPNRPTTGIYCMAPQAASATILLIFLIFTTTFQNGSGLVRESTRWPLAPFLRTPTGPELEADSDPIHRIGFCVAPLIGGPSWLPLHVKLSIEAEDGTRHLLDFVPKDATNPAVTGRLMAFQCVPGDVRYACQNSGSKPGHPYETRVVLHPSSDGTQRQRTLGRQQLDPRPEARIVDRAVQYSASYPDRDLHLLTNNCWSFAVRLYWHLLLASD
jgi:hypothetical protein